MPGSGSIGPMRVFLSNLGCKLNQAELEAMARRFHSAGHQVVTALVDADLHVVNSCTVTHLAARTSRRAVRRGQRQNPRLKTVLTGCYASHRPGDAAAVEGVDLVVDNTQKESLVEIVGDAFPDTLPAPRALPVPFVPLEFGNHRALVKVEDGCNMRCSFCIIPTTRGRQRSRPVAECVAEVRALAAAGAHEVVITGVQISAYRAGGAGLVELVEAMLEGSDVLRLRLTSIAPWQLDRHLLRLVGQPRVCRHLHLSLQSGCDATLRRMRRPYTAERYAEIVAEAREAVPGLAVTTDVIVGFPGETETEFEASRAFVRRLSFSKVHVFPYSERAGTAAAELPGAVEPAVRAARAAAMAETAAEGEEAFRRRHVGRVETVVWEGRRRGRWQGMTDNYLRVQTVSRADLALTPTATRLTAIDGEALLGEPCSEALPEKPVATRRSSSLREAH